MYKSADWFNMMHLKEHKILVSKLRVLEQFLYHLIFRMVIYMKHSVAVGEISYY